VDFSKYVGNNLVIVEGINDKKVLLKFGIENVIDISGKSFDEVLDKVKNNSVIILTDFDKEGRKKAHFLTKIFQLNGIKVDTTLRKKFKSIFKVQKIEELNSLIKLLEDDIHGEIGSIYGKIFDRSRIFDKWNNRKTRYNRCNIWTD
jgi:5S rRNA maturation endonuclease (ribonuclease M5)